MAGLLDNRQATRLPAVYSWLSHAEATKRIVEENYSEIQTASARLMVAVEENVLVQLEHLRTHPSVAAALARKQLNLHGWVYKFETGEVFTYDPDSGQFVPLDQPARRAEQCLPAISSI
jgi:carbonic anhydrase